MVSETISHYKVLKKIGQGGMGEVFLAQDTTLDRDVALKFLPEKYAQNRQALERFQRQYNRSEKGNSNSPAPTLYE